MSQSIQDGIIGVLVLLIGYIIWQLQRVQSRFDDLIASDHVHRPDYERMVGVLIERMNKLSEDFYTLRGEFTAHRNGEKPPAE